MACAEALRIQAYFDGEIDAADALRIEEHLQHCPDCVSTMEELDRQRSVLRQATYYRSSAGLRAAVTAAIDDAAGPHRPAKFFPRAASFWSGAGVGATLTGLAAALAMFMVL